MRRLPWPPESTSTSQRTVQSCTWLCERRPSRYAGTSTLTPSSAGCTGPPLHPQTFVVDGSNVVPDVHEVLSRIDAFSRTVRQGSWKVRRLARAVACHVTHSAPPLVHRARQARPSRTSSPSALAAATWGLSLCTRLCGAVSGATSTTWRWATPHSPLHRLRTRRVLCSCGSCWAVPALPGECGPSGCGPCAGGPGPRHDTGGRGVQDLHHRRDHAQRPYSAKLARVFPCQR